MHKWILLVLIVVGMSCFSSIVRDKKVYRAELNLMEHMALQPVDSLDEFVSQYCSCVDGHWTTPSCKKAADLILIVRTRLPYHKSMMLYNAGMLKKRPPKQPPEIPPAESLCGQGDE